MTTNPLTPHEVHTLREIIREQRQAAARSGRDLLNPWLAVERLLDERENLKDTIRIYEEKIREAGSSADRCQYLIDCLLQEVPF